MRSIPTEFVVPGMVALALVVFGLANPVFFSGNNVGNIVLQASIVGVIALGMTPVVVAGSIDLSVGAVAAVSAILMAKAVGAGVPSGLAVLFGLVVALGCGTINGTLVGFFGVPSFIATLGMMGIARGVALATSEGRPVSTVGVLPSVLGGDLVPGVPGPIVVLAAVTALAALVLMKTVWGVRLFAIGGNPRAAWISGVNVRAYVVGTLAASGLAAGLAGVVLAGRLGSAQPLAGSLYELDAITAVVLGGGSLMGGRGNAFGTLGGVVLLSGLRNAMVLVNLSPYYHQIVTGTVLVALLLAESIRRGNTDALKGLLR